MSASHILERPARTEVEPAERFLYPETLESQQVDARARRLLRELSNAADTPRPKDAYAELGGSVSGSDSPLDALDDILVDLQPNDALQRRAFEQLNATLLFRPGVFSAMTRDSRRLVAAQFQAYIKRLESFSKRAVIPGAVDDPLYEEYSFEDDEQAKQSAYRAGRLAQAMREADRSSGILQYADSEPKAGSKSLQKDFYVVIDSKLGKLRAREDGAGRLA